MDATKQDALRQESDTWGMIFNDNDVHRDVISEAHDVHHVVEQAGVDDDSNRSNSSGPALVSMQSHSFNDEQEESSMEPYSMLIIPLSAS